MQNKSFGILREGILKCLQESFQSNATESGWGLCKGSELSIVNTVEALLTYQELNALTLPFLESKKESLIKFLTQRTSVELEKPNVTTRYIAYGALGLHILGVNDLEDKCVEKLNVISRDEGGWSQVQGQGESIIVPTYHAMFALQNIGVSINEKHYAWLLSQQRSDNLLPFSPSDPEHQLRTSCLALISLPAGIKTEQLFRITAALKQRLPLIFEQMSQPNESWANQDSKRLSKSTATAMRFALNLLHTNLYTLDLHKFLLAASAFFERDSHKQTSPAFSLTPEQTWVPAIFELGLAFRAIRLNFDPFEYWSSIQTERISEVSTELETERNRLAQESRAIEIRQKVLDEWEKEVIRQRGMAQNFSSVKSEIARELNSVFQAQIVSFQGKLKSTVSFYFRLLLLL